MLAFVTSVRHPDNAADFDRVDALLSDTLRSVTAQTHDDYIVIVVGNVPPRRPLPPGVTFIQVDFEPRPVLDDPAADRDTLLRDKGSKLGVGLLAARDAGADFVMFFDADDFVHPELASWVAAHADGPGWYVMDGWMFSSPRCEAMPITRLHRTCGTSYIVPIEAYNVPTDLSLDASQDAVVEGYGEVLTAIIGSHRWAASWLSRHGTKLEPLPFEGTVYHVETGENYSGKTLRHHAENIGASVPDYRPRPPSWKLVRTYSLPVSIPELAASWVDHRTEAWAIARERLAAIAAKRPGRRTPEHEQ